MKSIDVDTLVKLIGAYEHLVRLDLDIMRSIQEDRDRINHYDEEEMEPYNEQGNTNIQEEQIINNDLSTIRQTCYTMGHQK